MLVSAGKRRVSFESHSSRAWCKDSWSSIMNQRGFGGWIGERVRTWEEFNARSKRRDLQHCHINAQPSADIHKMTNRADVCAPCFPPPCPPPPPRRILTIPSRIRRADSRLYPTVSMLRRSRGCTMTWFSCVHSYDFALIYVIFFRCGRTNPRRSRGRSGLTRPLRPHRVCSATISGLGTTVARARFLRGRCRSVGGRVWGMRWGVRTLVSFSSFGFRLSAFEVQFL